MRKPQKEKRAHSFNKSLIECIEKNKKKKQKTKNEKFKEKKLDGFEPQKEIVHNHLTKVRFKAISLKYLSYSAVQLLLFAKP